MAFGPGTKLGPYEVSARLGAGGMGEVWRARDTRLGRDVALKVLPDSVAADAELLARLRAEARAASALNHPNVVTVHDLGEGDGHVFISMELLDGRTLREVVDPGPPPLRTALAIAAQVAAGLAAAHGRGIVHRDLKPENIVVTKDGIAKILDFGIAKTSPLAPGEGDATATAGAPATTPGSLIGTVGYMSPEQASGAPVDFRSDQFSFGTILYELLTGRRAWKKATPVETLAAILREDPPPFGEGEGAPPAPVRWIVERCLAKEPSERYDSTRDLARDVRQVADRFGEVRQGKAASEAPRPEKGRGRAIGGALVLAGLLAGSGAAWKLLPRGATSPPSWRYLTYSGQDSEPAVSPDGKLVAFTSRRGGRRRIWLKQLADGSEVSLTSGDDRSPRFSPNGTSVLFTRVEEGGDALYTAPVLGGEPRRLVGNAFAGDFSPDGLQVAFLRAGADAVTGNGLFIIPVRGGEEKVVLKGSLVSTPPRWSPDAAWIAGANGGAAVRSAITRGPRLYLVRPDGKETKELSGIEDAGDVTSVSWLANGSLAFTQLTVESFSTYGRIGLVHPGRRGTETLVRSLVLGSTVEALGTGRLVVDALLTRLNLRETQLETGPWRDATPPGRWLTRGNANDRQPVYSPDGQKVLFSSNREGNEDLWELTLATGAIRRLTDHPARDFDPAYFADGKRIAWTSARGGNSEIWTANADGTGVKQLSRDGVDAENPTVSADGRWIVYGSYGETNPKRGLWVMHSDGTEARQVLKGATYAPEISPDGRFALFIEPGLVNATRVVRLADGVVLPLRLSSAGGDLRATEVFGLGRGRFTPDGRAIGFTGLDDQGRVGVFLQDFDPARDTTATRRRLAGFDADYATESFGFAPDGRRIVVGCALQSSDLMLVEGLPAAVAAARPPAP